MLRVVVNVTIDPCHIPDVMGDIRCTNTYKGRKEEMNNFLPGWMDGYNASVPASSRTRLEQAFLYTPPTEHEYPYLGKMASYPGGGYVADLTEHAYKASLLMHQLEVNQWVDEYTRAVLIEFNILNPNSKLFNQVILVFEYLTDGSTLWSTSVHVVQLYRYTGAAGVIALFSEIGCAIFVLVITIMELVKICRLRLRYFKDVWNALQWLALVLFYIAVGLYTARCLWTVWVVEDLMNNPGDQLVLYSHNN